MGRFSKILQADGQSIFPSKEMEGKGERVKDGEKEGREERSASSSVWHHSGEKSTVQSGFPAWRNEHFDTETVRVE